MMRGILEGMITEFELRGEWWKGETEVVRGASFTSAFDIGEISR